MVSKQQNLMAFQTLAGERLDQLSKKEDQITNQIDTYIGEIIAQIKRKQEEFHQTVRQVVGVRKREVNRKVSKSCNTIQLKKKKTQLIYWNFQILMPFHLRTQWFFTLICFGTITNLIRIKIGFDNTYGLKL